jgi:hypothetical protein
MGTREKIDTKGVWHFAIIKDVRETARRFWDDLGIGPWQFLTITGEHVELYGTPVALKVAAGITQIGPMIVALDKALTSHGPCDEIEAKRGGGAHHLASLVDDLDNVESAAAEMERRGHKTIFTTSGFGPNKDGKAAYFDTEGALGITIELAKVPTGM